MSILFMKSNHFILKMKFYIFIIAFFLASNSVSCLMESDDFCQKNTIISTCTAYNCGTKFCSFDKESCKNLIKWGVIMKKYVKETSNKYTHFIDSIKPCVKKYRNQWSHRMNFG
jgi:hypothetical protein